MQFLKLRNQESAWETTDFHRTHQSNFVDFHFCINPKRKVPKKSLGGEKLKLYFIFISNIFGVTLYNAGSA